MSKELAKLRKQIDNIDKKIVTDLNNRSLITLKIRGLKKKLGKGIYAPEREQEVLNSLSEISKGPLTSENLKAIYREIMSSAIALQRPLKIAYLGPEATFSHLAAIKRFGSQQEYLVCDSISDVFNEAEKGNADYGVVPIENSIEGAVTHTMDMLIDSDLKICSQAVMNISHNLLAKCPKNKIKKVYSITQVLGQCRIWLQKNLPGVERIDVSSTTKAAQIVQKEKLAGCIASFLAAKVYKLNVLASGIEDSPNNITRFLVLSKKDTPKTGNDKTSIVFSIKDKIGALHDMLVPFKKYMINMTKIESRPSKKKAWDYYFFVDFKGHKDDKNISRALKELDSQARFLKILGSYPNNE